MTKPLLAVPLEHTLQRARALAARGRDAEATQAYLALLRQAPEDFTALNELAALAYANGCRTAARTAWTRAVACHPGQPLGLVNLANLLLEDADAAGARRLLQAALDAAPGFAPAHQSMARALAELGDAPAAAKHREHGFRDHAVVARPHRGPGPGVPLLLLVSALGGNIPTRHWIDPRRFAVTAVYTEFFDPCAKLADHALVVNAIGDADLCDAALARAEAMLAGTAAPVINAPARVRATGRAAAMQRLSRLPGVIAPATRLLPRATISAAAQDRFPLLLRAPGFHTGRHFVRVDTRDTLAAAAASLPGEALLVIDYLDARGSDGMARKYRVMVIDGVLYPIHLAVSPDWKVHYFTATMAAHRAEEARFLDDMPGVLGARAMAALQAIGATLGLDYAGIDFALAPCGSVLLFEANAAMVLNPAAEDYRRAPVEAALAAAGGMLARRLITPADAPARSPAAHSTAPCPPPP